MVNSLVFLFAVMPVGFSFICNSIPLSLGEGQGEGYGEGKEAAMILISFLSFLCVPGPFAEDFLW
jgi:hypothetical protein